MSSRLYNLQPLTFSAAEGHRKKWVQYKASGEVRLSHPDLHSVLGKSAVIISPHHQFPLVFTSLTDLGKALSSLANSPKLNNKQSLREEFDADFAKYLEILENVTEGNGFEPDYGTYVFDVVTQDLFLIVPEKWHRVGLVTSTGHLLTDPEHKLTWSEVRSKLENTVVGFIGASVGGNLIEGVARELRIKTGKVADPDWIELNNLNRFERGTIRFLGKSRGDREDVKNAYEMYRYNKAEFTAYQQNLVDPYANWYVYPEGLTENNLEKFLTGDGKDEPRLDVLVEEADDLPLKIGVRKKCRELGIPVMMLSDFGHCAVLHFQDFSKDSKLNLAYECSDEELEAQLSKAMTTGNREDIFQLVKLLCGKDTLRDEFARWIAGEGEQPTSSLPQSGATAMISGGLGGKLVAQYRLGHQLPARTIFDFGHRTVEL